MKAKKLLRISGVKPSYFKGTILLPPSKSYLHRALFISGLLQERSRIKNCGSEFAEDVKATINFLDSLGFKIDQQGSDLFLTGRSNISAPKKSVFVGGSGTTARFAISYAALAFGSGRTRITGNESLSRRPMKPLIQALNQLGVNCRSENMDGCLPVIVPAGGIKGGFCEIDGSISSQFISSLMIACVRADEDTEVKVLGNSDMVSEPYVDATLCVLRRYGFQVRRSRQDRSIIFKIKSGQQGGDHVSYDIPGDLSSASAMIGAALCTGGSLKLLGANMRIPQPDSKMLQIARLFGGRASVIKNAIQISSGPPPKTVVELDLRESPDLVPAVFAMACGLGLRIKIKNIGHLRFKESDRIHTLAKQFKRLGMRTIETRDSLSTHGKESISRRKPLVLDPESDHRMLMAFTIAGLSGTLGEFYVSDPGCVNKSYPNFFTDLESLMRGEKGKILELVRKEN
ncbi:MAG: 3-phosphoshikimate 1-carboxyvinyltransferase [Nitrososphaerales archaeon]